MAEFLNKQLRVNETTQSLAQLNQQRATRVPAPAMGPGFRTLPDGTVINRFGHTVYTPARKDAATRT